jgi:hypothetical protein
MSVATLKDFWQPGQPIVEPVVVKVTALCAKTGKIRFATKQEARVQLKALIKISPNEVINTYRCWSCGDWHTGHSK